MKNTAWKDGDDEIYTLQRKADTYQIGFWILVTLIAIGFIVGPIIVNNL